MQHQEKRERKKMVIQPGIDCAVRKKWRMATAASREPKNEREGKKIDLVKNNTYYDGKRSTPSSFPKRKRREKVGKEEKGEKAADPMRHKRKLPFFITG